MFIRIFFIAISAIFIGLFTSSLLVHSANVPLSEIYSLSNAERAARGFVRLAKSTLSNRDDRYCCAEVKNKERLFLYRVDADGGINIKSIDNLDDTGLSGRIEDYNTLNSVRGAAFPFFGVRHFDGERWQQRFFYSREFAKKNPFALLRLLAPQIKHGIRDDGLSVPALLKVLGHRSLSMTCGKASAFMKQVLEQAGVKARVGTSLTLESWNQYDNGHTFLEVYFPEITKWGVVDVDAERYFTLPDGSPASILDIAVGGIQSVQVNDLTQDAFLDYSGFVSGQFYGEYVRENLSSWYGRVFQAVGIFDEQRRKYLFISDDPEAIRRIESYSPSYVAVSREEISEHFY
ncbi:MAG: hypothetical protein NXH88_16080 [Hyphomonas sp.]|nr:hypothetical protein [Hyphomonas sp.]